jgi:hypothetical protein
MSSTPKDPADWPAAGSVAHEAATARTKANSSAAAIRRLALRRFSGAHSGRSQINRGP